MIKKKEKLCNWEWKDLTYRESKMLNDYVIEEKTQLLWKNIKIFKVKKKKNQMNNLKKS